jgi:cysteine desulfurase
LSEGFAYLDYNATTPVKPAVAAAIADALGLGGNPFSVHRAGRAARRALEAARDRVAALVGAAPQGVIFTSGGTEANNLALSGLKPGALMISAVEHDSVRAAAANTGTTTSEVPVDGEGAVELAALEALLAEAPAPVLVSVMLANNETGAIQPVAEVAERVHAAGGRLHCDASQAPGRVALDMAALGADLLTLSAHKMGGPQGVGALVMAGEVEVAAMLHGGGQELGRRAGTENVPGIVGFGVAAGLAAEELAEAPARAGLRDSIEARLGAVAPALTVFGAGGPRLPNTTCLSMPGVSAETQVMALDLAGVGVSAGAACSSGKVAPSHVLAAMGVAEAEADTAIRVSLGWKTGPGDIDRLVEAWSELYIRNSTGVAAAEPAA